MMAASKTFCLDNGMGIGAGVSFVIKGSVVYVAGYDECGPHGYQAMTIEGARKLWARLVRDGYSRI